MSRILTGKLNAQFFLLSISRSSSSRMSGCNGTCNVQARLLYTITRLQSKCIIQLLITLWGYELVSGFTVIQTAVMGWERPQVSGGHMTAFQARADNHW